MLEFEKNFKSFDFSLELPIDHFEGTITKPLAHMRVLHYLPQDPKSGLEEMGIGTHSDYECLTILHISGVPALQVLSLKSIIMFIVSSLRVFFDGSFIFIELHQI